MKKMTKNGFWKTLAALPLKFVALPTMAFITLMTSAAFAQEGEGSVVGIAEPWELGFQVPASPLKEKMEGFHNIFLMPTITAITLLVMGLLIYVMLRYNSRANPVPSKTTHNTMIEVIWTLVPVLILVVIVIPSMRMLYFADKTHDAEMTLKITGFQWYWGYEYPDHGGVNFLSNLIPDKEIDASKGQKRLLSTDNVVVLPVDTNIRLLITASDVLHAWAIPSFGVKMDAVPGRTNETWVRIDKEGTFYGQCSELCGTNHGFMPIEVHAVSKEEFAEWVKTQGGKMPEAVDPDKVPAAVSGSVVEDKKAEPQKAATEMAPEDVKAQEDAKQPGNAVEEKTKEVIDAIPPVDAADKKDE